MHNFFSSVLWRYCSTVLLHPLFSCIYWCWWELYYWFLHICFIICLCFFLVAFEISLYHNSCEISLYCDWGYLYIYVHMCNFPSYVRKYLIGLFACQLTCISILGNLSALTWNISFLLSFYFLMELLLDDETSSYIFLTF